MSGHCHDVKPNNTSFHSILYPTSACGYVAPGWYVRIRSYLSVGSCLVLFSCCIRCFVAWCWLECCDSFSLLATKAGQRASLFIWVHDLAEIQATEFSNALLIGGRMKHRLFSTGTELFTCFHSIILPENQFWDTECYKS